MFEKYDPYRETNHDFDFEFNSCRTIVYYENKLWRVQPASLLDSSAVFEKSFRQLLENAHALNSNWMLVPYKVKYDETIKLEEKLYRIQIFDGKDVDRLTKIKRVKFSEVIIFSTIFYDDYDHTDRYFIDGAYCDKHHESFKEKYQKIQNLFLEQIFRISE